MATTVRLLAAILVLFAASSLSSYSSPLHAQEPLRFGSKKFTESVILGEMLTQLARSTGAPAQHRAEMQGTRILWLALLDGSIDAYPDYTGTIRLEILADEKLAPEASLAKALAKHGVGVTRPLGFNNTYALGVRAGTAHAHQLTKISDLTRVSDLAYGFTEEFVNRNDGWPGLRERYGLFNVTATALDHDVAYRLIERGDLDVVDLYSTDAEIDYYDLVSLEDDLDYFPRYDAVILYRLDLRQRAPEVVAALERLEGAIDEPTMVRLNRAAKIDRVPEREVAADFLEERFEIEVVRTDENWRTRLVVNTFDHLYLVVLSLFVATLVAIPLGILAARRPRFGALILAVVGVVQTIPALALLVFMIPLLGGAKLPALAALFLYSLLPIVRNTHAGIVGIPRGMRESAVALGLSARARLRRVELPLALPLILAGVKTAAVINVGTATLGALVGAGGYGQEILTGIRLDDTPRILEGALPAAGLAVVAQLAFAALERAAVPRGLRLQSRAAS